MIFKCKNCGGNVVYSPERKKMFCPFCESEDSEERQDGVIETSGDENSVPGSRSRSTGRKAVGSRRGSPEKGE